MPYYRRRYKRRYKPRYKKRYNSGSANKRINGLYKKIKQMNVENKPEIAVLDTTLVDEDMFTTPGQEMIMPTAKDKDFLRSIQFKLLASIETADLGPSAMARVVLVMDRRNRDPDANTPAWTDVFKTANVYSLRKSAGGDGVIAGRFKVWYDKTIRLMRDSDGTTQSKYMFTYYKNWKKPIRFSELATALGGNENIFYLMFMADTATGAIDLDGTVRVRYWSND